jgi:ABC-2 type transport system permease protein
MWPRLDLYRRLIITQIRAQLQYPVAFWFELLGTALITTAEFGSLALILGRFEGIGGWTLGEVAFLYGMVEVAFGTMDMLFSGFDPPFFGQQVRRGRFDQLLLRPVNITLQVLGSRLEIRRLGRIAQGVVIFGAALALTQVHWTLTKVIYLPVVFVSLVGFFGGLFIVGATITFWTVESIEVINILTYGGNEMMSYPMHIYRDWMRHLFTFVIPAIFLNYYPALYFLDKPDPFNLPPFAPFLAPAVGGGMLATALTFWRFGIRHYTSTGT